VDLWPPLMTPSVPRGSWKAIMPPRAPAPECGKPPAWGSAAGFGDASSASRNLSPRGDLKEAAANLFAMLRELDSGTAVIAVSPIPQTGLGEAINDRLTRAAAPRSPS